MRCELTYSQGQALRRRLAGTVCSSAWLDAIAPADNKGVVQGLKPDLYPPGDFSTAMSECAACKRIGPPNGVRGICADCETEEVELAFWERCLQASTHDRTQLLRRWWREPVRFYPTVRKCEAESWGVPSTCDPPALLANPAGMIFALATPHGRGTRSEEVSAIDERKPTDPSSDSDGGLQEKRSDRRVALEIACRILGVPSPGIRFYDPIPRSSLAHLPEKVAAELVCLAESFDRRTAPSVRAATTAFRRVCQPLGEFAVVRRRKTIALLHGGIAYCLLRYEPVLPTRNVSIGSGRSAGCVLTLLPEDEQALRREIAYANEHGQAALSARRFTRPNPYRSAPEDRLDVLSCFGARRPRRTSHK